MQVTKRFHFYAAHRNEEIGGKCASIHGHRYGVEVTVEEPPRGSVTILFDDLEGTVNSVLSLLDHSLLLNESDPARAALEGSGACQKIYLFPCPTSAENVAAHLFSRLRGCGLNVVRLSLQETDTSSVTIS